MRVNKTKEERAIEARNAFLEAHPMSTNEIEFFGDEMTFMDGYLTLAEVRTALRCFEYVLGERKSL
jgi:hypothetical protein